MSTWTVATDTKRPATEAGAERDGSRARLGPRTLNGQSAVVKTIDELPTVTVDAVRELLSKFQALDSGQALPDKFGVTSALSGEGVSFISRAIAAVLAHDFRQRVCLVDLNWPIGGHAGSRSRRRRRRNVGADDADTTALVGLADVLRRELSRREHLLDEDDPRRDNRRATPLRELLFETNDPRLTYVAAGAASVAEAQVFARSEQLTQVITALARHHDRLVLDLPAVLGSSVTIPLARQADAVGVVVRHGVTTEAQVRSALERLGSVRVAGVVLNRTSSKIPRPLRRRIAAW